jgi:hypothetical protein
MVKLIAPNGAAVTAADDAVGRLLARGFTKPTAAKKTAAKKAAAKKSSK